MEEFETIVITFEDGEEAEFCVLEQTQLMGKNYYLVAPVEDMENDKSSYDYTSDIYYAIAKSNSQLDKLKSLYNALISKMNIRPINWINTL